MPKQPRSRIKSALDTTVHRRDALKGLGALAVSLPVFGSAACSEQAPEDAMAPEAGGGAGAAGGGLAGAGNGGAAGMDAAGTTGGALPSGSGSGAAGSGAVATTGESGAGGTGGTAGEAAAGSGGAGGAAGSAGGAGSAGSAGAAGSAGPGGGLIPVSFDDVPACTLTPTDPAGEGPFYIHEDEVMDDIALFRADLRDGKDGVELQLNLRVLDSDADCMTPISGVEVYVWHTDATGFYSGFDGQNPNQSYSGGFERTVENADRFCRGAQLTDAEGVVSFRTLYPGWYNGRAIHIHFLALRPGSGPGTASYRGMQYQVFTTQMYFEEAFSRMIHENNAPYDTRASGAGYTQYVKPQNTIVVPKMRMEGAVAVGALNIVTAASGSRR